MTMFQNQPQVEFKLPEAATVEYFPDPEQESNAVVFKTKEGRPILIMPVSVYKEFEKRCREKA